MNIEELEQIKQDIKAVYNVMYNFDDRLCDDMQVRVKRIETLLTAYENLKSYNRGTKEALRVAEDLEHQANKETGDWESRYFELEAELEKEKETSHYIQSQLDIANAKLVEEKEKNKEYKNLLIDMVNQFAYEDNNPKTRGSSKQKIYTAGLSTLEDAFYLLDIDEGIKREDLWKLKEE